MPNFLDVHSMKGFTGEPIRKAQKELPDEFIVTTENYLITFAIS
jgi:hypothetical protein